MILLDFFYLGQHIILSDYYKRETGFEPATSSLEGYCSTN